MSNSQRISITALRIPQWMPEWDNMTYDNGQRQSRPRKHFYMFSLPANRLRELSGVYRRVATDMIPRTQDIGIQRRHDKNRSAEIKRYIKGGYPWSTLSDSQRTNPENQSLRKPGWLPTAIVVNILIKGDQRDQKTIDDNNLVEIDDNENGISTLYLPNPINDSSLPPFEIIDGQHRLYAFDTDSDTADFHLPVIAFHGLDISWQAYLFWTINIKPKKINASLAYDLYPLLREEDWLKRANHVAVYAESRAQELTEMLWSTPGNPWYRRINMLGGPRSEGPVTQAAFIRSLISSMVKSWKRGKVSGGIFGGTPDNNEGLSWSRVQQGAFLYTAWKILAEEIEESRDHWAINLRELARVESVTPDDNDSVDFAFTSRYSLLATDQGVRAYQAIINDIFYELHRELELQKWTGESDEPDSNVATEGVNPQIIQAVATTIPKKIIEVLQIIAHELSMFDWRTSGTPELSHEDRQLKSGLRGAGGYKLFRELLFQHLASASEKSKEVAKVAAKLLEAERSR